MVFFYNPKHLNFFGSVGFLYDVFIHLDYPEVNPKANLSGNSTHNEALERGTKQERVLIKSHLIFKHFLIKS